MNAIMMATKPRFIQEKATGTKTIEIRKFVPKQWKEWLKDTSKPFPETIVYEYCTTGNFPGDFLIKNTADDCYSVMKRTIHGGKVVAMYKVTKIEEIVKNGPESFHTKSKDYHSLLEAACLEMDELSEYVNSNGGYAIYVTSFVFFEKPRPIVSFQRMLPPLGSKTPSIISLLSVAPECFCYVGIHKEDLNHE